MRRPKDIVSTPGQGADPKRHYWNVVLDNGHYVESNHSGNFMAKVFKALEANGLYSGTGWQDNVWEKVCEQNPHIPCVDTEVAPIVTGWADIRRFFITLGDLLGSGRPLVEPEVQEQRIQTCLACPLLVNSGQCSGCSWVAQKLSELAGNRRIKDESLVHRKSCAACGCEASVKTAYPMEILKEVDKRLELKQPYWSGCWMTS